MKWEVTSTTNEMNGDVPVITKAAHRHVDNSAYPQITVDDERVADTPGQRERRRAGDMEFGFGACGARSGAAPRVRGNRRPATGPTWQQQVLAKGWGYASISTGSVQADNGAGLTQGIIGLVEQRPAAQAG